MGLKAKFVESFFSSFFKHFFVSYFDIFQVSTAPKLLWQFEKKLSLMDLEDSEASFFHGLCEHFDIWNNIEEKNFFDFFFVSISYP